MGLLGNIALILALLAALYAGAAFILSWRPRFAWLRRSARLGVGAVAGFTTLAVATLLMALVTHDFSLEYVASYSSLETSPIYLVTALWAGNAGSVLFWGWLIALAAAVLMRRETKSGGELLPFAFPAILLTEILFLVLILIHNPFTGLDNPLANGIGLNPLLENAGMIFHPPLLLAGFALLVVPFSLAVAALISNKLAGEWVATARRWALAAWVLLGVGNILGMWWAYAELGWGGYWAWDPVENAGLMPWLLLTAFLHSTMMERRRGLFRSWNMLLIIFTFNLTIFGAFLTRSDILNSVHTFGETAMGPVFIGFLSITLLGSLALMFWRRRSIHDAPGDDAFISGENTFLLNNLLLVAATFAIFIGTMYPFFSEVFTGNRTEMESAFFNQVNLPIFLALILLGGLCVLIGWKKPDLRQLGKRLLWPALAGLVPVAALIVSGKLEWYVLAAVYIAAFTLVSTLLKWWVDIASARRASGRGYAEAFKTLFSANRGRYGGYIVHVAILIMALGITGSSVYEEGQGIVLAVGDSYEISGYTLVYNGLIANTATDRMSVMADIDVTRNGRITGKLQPVKWFHTVQQQVVTEVAIRSNLVEDLYVILDDWDDTQNAAFTILVNPMVSWIWIGGFLLLVGGLVSFSAAPRKSPDGD